MKYLLQKIKNFKNGILIKFVKLICYIIPFLICFRQISYNFISFRESSIITEMSIKTPKFFEYPTFTICPYPNFNPYKLIKMGLEYNKSFSANSIVRNIDNYQGIDKEITGKRLLEEAGWNLGELIKEVNYGEFHQIFDEKTTEAPLWKRDFHFGPTCYTFTPLPTKNHSVGPIISIRSLQERYLCTWTEWEVINICLPEFQTLKNNKSFKRLQPEYLDDEKCFISEKYNRTYKYRLLCYDVQENCNTTCEWEKMLNFMHLMGIMHPLVESTNEMKTVMISHPFSSETTVTMKLIEIDSYYGLAYNKKECIKKCALEKLSIKNKCEVLTPDNSDLPLSYYCPRSRFHYITTYYRDCAKECPRQKFKKFWMSKSRISKLDRSYKMILNNDYVEKIKEKPSYSYFTFFADIGGNLGFFMGISLFIIIHDTPSLFNHLTNIFHGDILIRHLYMIKTNLHFLYNRCKISKYSKKISDLATLSLYLILLVLCITHILIISNDFIHQDKYKSISLHENNCVLVDNGTSCVYEPSDIEWTLSLIATKSFHCKIQFPSLYRECKAECIIKSLIQKNTALLPYVLNDQETCKDTIPIQNIYFIVPSDVWVQIRLLNLTETKLKDCLERCTSLDTNIFAVHLIPKMREIYLLSISRYICSICGTIGLYFSWSLLGIVEIVLKKTLRLFIKSENRKYNHLPKIISSFLLFFVTFITFLQLLNYILRYQYIVTSIETQDPNKNFPTITACPKYESLPLKNARRFINSNFIPGPIQCRILRGETIGARRLQNYQLDGQDCYSCLSQDFKEIDTITNDYLVDVSWNQSLSKETPKYIDFILHHPNDLPIPYKSLDYDYMNNDVRSVTIYTNTIIIFYGRGHEKGYSLCFMKCIKEYYKTNPKYVTNMENTLVNISKLCEADCEKSYFTLFHCKNYSTKGYEICKSQIMIRISRKSLLLKNFEIQFQSLFKAFQKRQESTNYSVLQFINDVGSFVGFVMGVSILSIFMSFCNWFE